LFQKFIKVVPSISPSVFWKYTKREVYANKDVHRNRKTGGYKGLSGVQFRQPAISEDLDIIEKKLEKLEQYLTVSKAEFIDTLKQLSQEAQNKKEQTPRATPRYGKKRVRELDSSLLSQSAIPAIIPGEVQIKDGEPLVNPLIPDTPIQQEQSEAKRRRISTEEPQMGIPKNQMPTSQLNPRDLPIPLPVLLETQLPHFNQIIITQTAIESIRLLNDPEVLNALRNLKDIVQNLQGGLKQV